MEDDRNFNRRKVLRNIAVAGSASLFGMTASVGASPEEASVDIDRLLQTDRIQKLKETIPGLEFSIEDARVLEGERGIVLIPANLGVVLTRPPGETDAASFYPNEWIPGVDSDWVEGTQARLRVTDDDMVLTRSATDEESEEFLKSVGATEFDRENMTVAVQPVTGKVMIAHIDTENRRYDRIQAEPAEVELGRVGNGLAAANAGLEVTSRETEHFSDISKDIKIQSHCDQNDVIFCIAEAINCIPCALLTPTGPVFAVCIVFVCLGFPAQTLVTILADIGCLSLGACGAEEVIDIVNDLIDEYADDIPI